MNQSVATSVKTRPTAKKKIKSKRSSSSSSSTPQPLLAAASATQIKWLDTGKPVLEGVEQENIDISLSHDDQVCLCVAGKSPQGCDILPITHRTRENWTALLTLGREPLMQQLLSAGVDSVDVAGTRIWAALEALRKATNLEDSQLVIERQAHDSVLFRGVTSGLLILTFPVTLTRGTQRMVAVVVSASAVERQKPTPVLTLDEDETIYHLKTVSEPNQVFVIRWPVSYKETANMSQSVYFSNFFNWMGRLRDLAIWSIREPLDQHLSTGEWGMVTNSARTQVLGEVGLNDVVEGRFWVAKRSGVVNSTVDFHYDWLKVLPNGEFERVAQSQLGMTWVHIPQHGKPQPQPLPEFLETFIAQLYRPDYTPEVVSSSKTVDIGQRLYQTSNSRTADLLLQEQRFETTLEDTDAIGNLNFAHYPILQGRVRDRFFYQLVPQYYRRGNAQGEFRCLSSQVEYLREALPFDQIQVSMALRAVYERSVSLAFEYSRLTSDGDQQKIAVGQHDALWFVRTEDKRFVPALLPTTVRNALLQRV
ncbi:MAG: hypothetical protein F6K55_16095 [Moorea sp. SIO4A3]|nr:hypothetical protein [Moorena sp. SIO4A3]